MGASVVGGLIYVFVKGGSIEKARQAKLQAFASDAGLSYQKGDNALEFTSQGTLEGVEVSVEQRYRTRRPGGLSLMARYSAKAPSPLPVVSVMLARSEQASESMPGLARLSTNDDAFDAIFLTRAAEANHLKVLTPQLRALLLELEDNLRGHLTLTTGPEVELVYKVGTTDPEFEPARLRKILDTVCSAARA